jgi:hypothetical protein
MKIQLIEPKLFNSFSTFAFPTRYFKYIHLFIFYESTKEHSPNNYTIFFIPKKSNNNYLLLFSIQFIFKFPIIPQNIFVTVLF